MPYLSKVKLNGTVYNLKDSEVRVLATSANNGLMSAQDKNFLDSLNPNMAATLTDINSAEF